MTPPKSKAPAAAKTVQPAPAPINPVATAEVKKEKRVRTSFNMPESQLALLDELKARRLRFGINAKKGEILAAGVNLLQSLPEASFEAAIRPSLRAERKAVNGKMRKN
jgi:hypothetical protein